MPGITQNALRTGLADSVDLLTRLSRAPDFPCDKIGLFARRVAGRLGLPKAETCLVGRAAVVHDVAMRWIPSRVHDHWHPLTFGERTLLDCHPLLGEAILRVSGFAELAPVVVAHHERWDGTGYPNRIAGVEIPIGARIICLLQAFCALRTETPNRHAKDTEGALLEIKALAGTRFDPAVVDAFLAEIRSDALRQLGCAGRRSSGGTPRSLMSIP